jgi:hypothetical protein
VGVGHNTRCMIDISTISFLFAAIYCLSLPSG